MSYHQVFAILWARKMTILVVTLISFGAAWIALKFVPQRYEATAQIFLNAAERDPVTSAGLPLVLARSHVYSQMEMIKTRGVATKVVDLLKLTTDPRWASVSADSSDGDGGTGVTAADVRDRIATQLLASLEVTRVGQSDIISITYRSAIPDDIAKYANAFAEAAVANDIELKVLPARDLLQWYDDRLAQLRNQLTQSRMRLTEYRRNSAPQSGQGQGSLADNATNRTNILAMQGELDALQKNVEDLLQRRERIRLEGEVDKTRVSILTRAATPTEPSFPKRGIVLGVALGLGLAMGLAMSFLREMVDRRIRCADDLESCDVPVLAVLPKARIPRRSSRVLQRMAQALPAAGN